jgi:hypothetical protein
MAATQPTNLDTQSNPVLRSAQRVSKLATAADVVEQHIARVDLLGKRPDKHRVIEVALDARHKSSRLSSSKNTSSGLAARRCPPVLAP